MSCRLLEPFHSQSSLFSLPFLRVWVRYRPLFGSTCFHVVDDRSADSETVASQQPPLGNQRSGPFQFAWHRQKFSSQTMRPVNFRFGPYHVKLTGRVYTYLHNSYRRAANNWLLNLRFSIVPYLPRFFHFLALKVMIFFRHIEWMSRLFRIHRSAKGDITWSDVESSAGMSNRLRLGWKIQ